jgi:ABC-type transport system involved in multi-copper enzyme maturation permease subunit
LIRHLNFDIRAHERTMIRRPRSFGLPLLGKELTELAARRRTYVIRFLYGALLFGGGLVILYGRAGGEIDVAAGLGQGIETFQGIVQLQFAAIYVFLPAMTAGALTLEKERDTLTLLFLTTLSPWTILLQKLLSRVIPMMCFVVLSFPLMAAAYSFGGVTTSALYSTMILLVLCVVQVASIALLCSAFCRTTVEAFMATYLLLAVAWLCVPLSIPFDPFRSEAAPTSSFIEARCLLMALSALCSLLLARWCLVERAFVPPRNVLLLLFQALDNIFNEWNQVTGGVVLVRDGSRFPEDRPVAWRETAKKSLGTFRYLFRVLVVLELPILGIATTSQISAVRSDSPLSRFLYLVWGVAAAMVAVHAASVVSSERSRQSLDVLLTTPLSGADLLKQKMAGVRRLFRVLLVPFASIFLFHHWFRSYGLDFTYVALSVASVCVFLPLTAWLSMWLGLVLRTQMRAVFAALSAVSLLAGLPWLARVLLSDVWGLALPAEVRWLLALGPASVIPRLEAWHALDRRFGEETVWMEAGLLTLGLALYALAAGLLRWQCLRRSDRLLGRVEEAPRGAAEVGPAFAVVEGAPVAIE